MALNDNQYERVARWLDGEEIELSAEEQDAARQIAQTEESLADRLDVRVPDGTLERAWARAQRPGKATRAVTTATAQPRARGGGMAFRVGRWLAPVAAAAAIFLIATLLHRPEWPVTVPESGPEISQTPPVEAMLLAMAVAEEDENLWALERHVGLLAEDLARVDSLDVSGALDAMDRQLEMLAEWDDLYRWPGLGVGGPGEV